MNKSFVLFEGIVTNFGLPRDDEMVKELYELLAALNDPEKPEVTEAGLGILEYMQTCGKTSLKAKDIADGMGVSSRKVSGSIRKLVTDGFVEKVGQNPVIYSLSDKGKDFDIENYKNQIQNNEKKD